MATVPPRPINGSVGSRIRVILGDSGDDWLLVTNHDDGNRKWQTKIWSGGIPDAVARQIRNCTNKDRLVKEVDFNTDGCWYVEGVKEDGTGDHSWWGGTSASEQLKEMAGESHHVKVSFGSDIYRTETYCFIQGRNGYALSSNLNSGLENRIKQIHEQNKAIDFVRLFDNGYYFISDDNGSEWVLPDGPLSEELAIIGKVEEVAKAKDGAWIVIRANHYVSSTGVDNALEQKLKQFYRDQKNRNNQRTQAINAYRIRKREEREARERAEREAREMAEQAERDAAEREAREAAAAIEAAERAEERAKKEDLEKANTRAAVLESKLEERLREELKSIKELEQYVQNRKQSLRQSIMELPPSMRQQFKNVNEKQTISHSECVVCQDTAAVRAVVPCGHLCLCDTCANSVVTCPLCRGQRQSTLKIFGNPAKS
mmetsp:Transcript_27390/g.39674  ORF Transcript_27390/g.39674 Transcript_27390/m.39674 type:complete len:429 (-) Transcript_27390:732-2018(-)